MFFPKGAIMSPCPNGLLNIENCLLSGFVIVLQVYVFIVYTISCSKGNIGTVTVVIIMYTARFTQSITQIFILLQEHPT